MPLESYLNKLTQGNLRFTPVLAHAGGMLRRSTSFLLAAALIGAICRAQDAPADQKTRGNLNGRFWSRMDDTLKLAFLLGFCEAATGTFACPKQLEFGEITQGIDRFYQEPENLRLPILAAMRVLAMKVEGARATEIDGVMNAAREYADKPEPKVPLSPPPPK